MPNIRQYINQVPVFRPTSQAEAAAQEAGLVQLRRAEVETGLVHEAFGRLKRGLDTFEQHRAVTEISQGATAAIGLQNDLTKQWNQLAASTDPNLIGKAADAFNQNVAGPAIDKFSEGFETDQGKVWASEHANSLKQHFFEKTAADSSTAAGDALIQNLDALKNHASDLVQNDPSSMNAALGLIDTSTEALITNSPNLPAGAASRIRTQMVDKMKQEVVTASVFGIAQKNPAAAREFLAGNPAVQKYMDADQIRTMGRGIDTIERENLAQQKSDEAEARRAQKDAFDGAINQIQLSAMQPDGTTVIPKDFTVNLMHAAAMPGANPATLRAMMSWRDAVAKDANKAVTDPQVYHNFLDRIDGSSSQPLEAADIYKARGDGSLSDKDMKFFLSRVSGKGDPAKAAADKAFDRFMRDERAAFFQKHGPPLAQTVDPHAADNFRLYHAEMQKFFDEAYARGNWRELLDPNSPKYLDRLAGQFIKGKGQLPQYLSKEGVYRVGDVVSFKDGTRRRFAGGDPTHTQNWVRVDRPEPQQ